jgi:hypothetical protein
MKKILFMMLAVMALVSCSKFEVFSDEDIKTNGSLVELSGVIEDMDTRAGAGVISGKLSADLSVSVFRADMSADATPVYSKYNADAIAGTVAEKDGKLAMSPKQRFFPNAARKSKFIAVYPSDGTFTNEAGSNKTTGTVTFALDGKTDVMCTNIAEGYKGLAAMPKLTFKHLLTRVDVKIQAEAGAGYTNNDIRALWGNIKTITVKDKKIDAVVTLPAATDANTATASIAAVTGGTATALSLWNGTAAPGEAALPDAATYFGYAMFLPVTDGKLTFNISTTDGGDTTATTQADKTYEAGKSYTIIISFTLENIPRLEFEESGSGSFDDFENGDGSGDPQKIGI